MEEPLAGQVMPQVGEARELYHRLIPMVGPAGSGKTSALREASLSTSAPLINVNLELSRRMLDLTQRQRALQAPKLLGEIAWFWDATCTAEQNGAPGTKKPAVQNDE